VQQLRALGLETRYARFTGIDGTLLKLGNASLRPGEVGAFHSHTRALEAARGAGTCTHILEDDAVFSQHTAPVIQDAVVSGLFDRFDILFTDTLLAPHLGMLKALKSLYEKTGSPPARSLRVAEMQTIDLAGENFSCLTSYLVSPKAADRIANLLRQEIASGPQLPVDLFIRDCVRAKKLRAACLFPFVTTLDLNEIARSTISSQDRMEPSVMVLSVLRYGFFVGCDLTLAKRYMDAATTLHRTPRDAHHDLILQALDFVMSDDFKEF